MPTPLSPVASLLADITALQRQADLVNVFDPFSAYVQLKALGEVRKTVADRLDSIHEQFRVSLDAPVSGPTGLIEVFFTVRSAKGVSALLQAERAWHDVGATIDGKKAFSFGFFSLYIALISLAVSVISML